MDHMNDSGRPSCPRALLVITVVTLLSACTQTGSVPAAGTPTLSPTEHVSEMSEVVISAPRKKSDSIG